MVAAGVETEKKMRSNLFAGLFFGGLQGTPSLLRGTYREWVRPHCALTRYRLHLYCRCQRKVRLLRSSAQTQHHHQPTPRETCSKDRAQLHARPWKQHPGTKCSPLPSKHKTKPVRLPSTYYSPPSFATWTTSTSSTPTSSAFSPS